MIKTIVTPKKNSYNLAIPNNYIGKKIEILFYALDEVREEDKNPKKSMADFWGVISDQTAKEMHQELEKSREEWEDRMK